MRLKNKIKTFVTTVVAGVIFYTSVVGQTPSISNIKEYPEDYDFFKIKKNVEVKAYVKDIGYKTVSSEDVTWFYWTWFYWPYQNYTQIQVKGNVDILSIELSDKPESDGLIGQIIGRKKNLDVLGMIYSYAEELKKHGEKIHVEGPFDKTGILYINFVDTDPVSSSLGWINPNLSLDEIIIQLGGLHSEAYKRLEKHVDAGRRKIYFGRD